MFCPKRRFLLVEVFIRLGIWRDSNISVKISNHHMDSNGAIDFESKMFCHIEKVIDL